MKRAGFLLVTLLSLLVGVRPASAATFEWGGTVEGRLGYGTNPFLNRDSNEGAGFAGFTVAPTLRWRSPTNVTELSGSYNRDQYFSRFGHTEDYSVDLRRTQTLSSKLTANAHVGYFSSVSGLLSPYYNTLLVTPGAVDELAVGTRQRRIETDAGLNWQPTARDTYRLNAVYAHQTYSSFGGDYDYAGVTGAYLRTLDAKTRVGVDVTVAKTWSDQFPDSSSIQPDITLQRTLSPYWTFNGGIGLIIEHEQLDGRSRTNVSPGFNLSLCGTYPRSSVCLTASRASAASGLGGLRRETQVGVNGTYRINEHSRILAVGTYGVSDSDQTVLIDGIRYGDQHFALGRLDYQRDLSRRVTAGVGGSYQARSGAGLPHLHALAIDFNLTAKFGHLS